jgi:hypothetical protein
MVAHRGHASGEEPIPIKLLVQFGKNILKPVKSFCQKHDVIICGTVNELDTEFFNFGEDIMNKHGRNEQGHSVSQTQKSQKRCWSLFVSPLVS